MGTREKYAPGTFCWVELITSDQDRAKEFYRSLLGWDYDDSEMPGGAGVYSMVTVDGRHVAGMVRNPNMPPD